MANVFISEDTLTAIGNAIRAKTGETELINTVDMASKIEGIKSENKLKQIVERTATVITAEDLAGVEKIGENAFYNYDSLTSVTIGDSVTTIGKGAFEGCNNLTSVTIPDSVTTIGGAAFFGCTSLTSVTIPDSVTTIGNEAFRFCNNLTSVTIGDSVTSIGVQAFESCNNLTSVTIPDSVITIGNNAFYNCNSLKSVTIPDSVTTIGSSAFRLCERLTVVIIEGDVVKTSKEYTVFYGTPIQYGTGFIYIKPASPDVDEATLVEEYKNATNWTVYASQIKGYSEYPIEEE